MGSYTAKSIEIHAVRTISGNQPAMRRLLEGATQTFKAGTPVTYDPTATTGGLKVWGGSDVTDNILGFSAEAASNLTTLGVAKTLTFGSVPNQSSAVNIPRGAPLNDGACGVELASLDTVFYGQLGKPTATAASDEYTNAVTTVGKTYGLTLDTDGHWMVDIDKTNAVRIVKVNPNDPRGVEFVVLDAVRQILA